MPLSEHTFGEAFAKKERPPENTPVEKSLERILWAAQEMRDNWNLASGPWSREHRDATLTIIVDAVGKISQTLRDEEAHKAL